jgi:hypothetical protein
MTAFYTEQEIADYGLIIPTDAEIDEALQQLDEFEPRAGHSSLNFQNPNPYCVCSQLGVGQSGGGCTVC